MATGAVAPYIPADIEGIEHADSYEAHSLDPKDYEGHTICIISSGNSAFEVADHLAPHAAIIHIMVRDTVRHAWNTHFPGDLRAINNTILAQADTTVTDFVGNTINSDGWILTNGFTVDRVYDFLIGWSLGGRLPV